MTSGGARARSGPPPDPNALRRERDRGQWRTLPAAGRSGPAPAWPLSRPTVFERRMWEREWQRPQAVVWEERGQALEVALYVRAVAKAETKAANAGDRALPLRYMDDLGISQGGLAKNRWMIGDAGAQPQQVTAADDPDRASAKARFRTIAGGAAS